MSGLWIQSSAVSICTVAVAGALGLTTRGETSTGAAAGVVSADVPWVDWPASAGAAVAATAASIARIMTPLPYGPAFDGEHCMAGGALKAEQPP